VWQRRRGRAGALVFGAAVAAVLGCAPAWGADKLYKWTDEKGQVHYTDKMPPEMVNRGNVEMSKQGITVNKTDPAIAADPQAKQAEEQRKRDLAREKEDAQRHDRAVLDSYTTEADIDLARNRALKTIASALESAQSYTAQLTKRRSTLVEKKVDPGDKAGQAAFDRELARIDGDLARQNAFVTQKEREITSTNAKYDEDKQRWRAALARKQLADTAPTSPAAPAPAAAAQAKAKK